MGILSDIERLITEHASASVLKDRIALAEDKYAALERKVTLLTEENAKLRLDNEDLKKLAPSQSAPAVEEIGDKLLMLLSHQQDLHLSHIARSLGVSEQLAAFHVEELENARMISGSYSAMSPSTYSLDQEGRRYLIKKGLLR